MTDPDGSSRPDHAGSAADTADETTYAVLADHDGFTVTVGPMDIGQALLFVDDHVRPADGWLHRFVRLYTPDQAAEVMAPSRPGRTHSPVSDPDQMAGQALHATLRRAVRGDPTYGGLDDPAVQQLLAHLDPHRPLRLYQADDEDCLLGECDHPRGPGQLCPEIVPADLVCVACTPIYAPGGDWGSTPLRQCRVAWPCGVLRATASHYQLVVPR